MLLIIIYVCIERSNVDVPRGENSRGRN